MLVITQYYDDVEKGMFDMSDAELYAVRVICYDLLVKNGRNDEADAFDVDADTQDLLYISRFSQADFNELYNRLGKSDVSKENLSKILDMMEIDPRFDSRLAVA